MSLPADRDPDVTRRAAIGSILQAALLAHPLGSRLLVMAGPSLASGARPDLQPLMAEVRRLIEAMEYLGEPFTDADRLRRSSAFSTRSACSWCASIPRAGCRWSAVPGRHGWWSAAGAPSSSKCA